MSDQGLKLLIKTHQRGLAHIVRGVMENAKIPCFVFDDHPSGIGMGTMDMRVMVPADRLEEARKLLKEQDLEE